MKEWKTYKLYEVANLTTGFPFAGEKYAKEGTRVVRGDNVTIGALRWDSEKLKCWNEPFERFNEFSLKEGDIVIGMDGSRVGQNRAQVKNEDLPLLLAQRVACIRNNEKSIQDFLYYLIFNNRFVDYVKQVQTGTSIPHISLKQIGNYEVNLPSIETQTKISHILRTLDNKIEINKRINDNLEHQAEALYKSWFVDFEPFKDQEFVESEFGLIPEGWQCTTLSELLSIKYGKDHKKLAEGTIPVYGSGGLMRYVDTKLHEGEAVLIPRKGTLNNVMYVNEAFWTVDTMFYSIPKQENSCIYAYLFLANKDLASMNAGSAVPSMTTDILNNMLIIAPPAEVLRQFNNICNVYFSRINQNNIENANLSNQRDTLLPKLMSGELKVNEIDC